MHAVMITFRSEATLDDIHDDFLAGAHAIAEVPGLRSKTWIANDGRLGGFYLFTDAEAATTYLDGPIIAETQAVPAFFDWDVQQFSVIEEFSAITRGIPTPAPAAAD